MHRSMPHYPRIQDYIADLHNNDNATTPEQHRLPPRSYVNPASVGPKHEHLAPEFADSSGSRPPPTSDCATSANALSNYTTFISSTSMNNNWVSNRDYGRPFETFKDQNVSHSRESASTIRNQACGHQPRNRNLGTLNTRSNSHLNFNQAFDLEINPMTQDTNQAAIGQLTPAQGYELKESNRANCFVSPLGKWVYRQPNAHTPPNFSSVNHTLPGRNRTTALLSAAVAVPVAIKARHDRDAHYTISTREDGSGYPIKVPMPLRHLRLEEEALATPTEPADGAQLLCQGKNHDEEDGETWDEFKIRLTHAVGQMMFVSGEQVEPSPETTWMIEEIVREQVVEMLKEATMLANRRGSKSISIVDLIFQIRHNPAKVSRLKTFLSWKDVRKNVKDSDDKAGGADADALDLEEGALPGANPAAPQKSSTTRKAKLLLPWEVQSFYNETVPEREDEEDEEEEEQNEATLARLASADERTKNMTREEYVYWSECRQASFTFRKGKRFREWAGFGTIIDSKPNDDVVDILGFLTFEIVQTLTEEALKVKMAEDLANKKASSSRGDSENSKKRKREGCTLFEMVEEDKTPVEPKHVREAFRRLQFVPKKYTFMRQGYAGVRTPLRMI